MVLPSPSRLPSVLAGHARQASRRFLLVVLLATGVACGLIAVAFHSVIELARSLLIGRALEAGPPALRLALVVAVPVAMGALLAVAIPRISARAGGGLALVRRTAQVEGVRITPRDFLGTFVANPLSLGAGTPLGPEGPTVVLTSGLAGGVGRLLGLPSRVVKGMIPVGTAAGIAAIFNTPITGVVFALEEILGTSSRGVLGGALVAAVAAAVVEKAALGGRRLLPAAPAAWNGAPELLGFALLGAVAGALAGALPRLVPVLRAGIRRITERAGRGSAAARGAIAGLVVGLVGAVAPDTLGVGYGPVSRWLSGGGSGAHALVACTGKTLGMSVALAGSLFGGVFAPSLFVGASLGSAMGHALRLAFPLSHIDPGAYALVGMGAFFAGFLRTPIASVLIVFELTGDYGLVVPQMLSVAIATGVARQISHRTLVEQQLDEVGVRVHSFEDPLSRCRVGDAMTRALVTVPAEADLLEAARAVAGTPHRVFPVVDREGRLAGLLDAPAIDAAARDGRLEESVLAHAYEPAVVATPGETLDAVSMRLAAAGETRCPVLESRASRRLAGLLTPADILKARLGAQVDETGGFGSLG